MEAYVLVLFLSRDHGLVVDIQNEEACVKVARAMSQVEQIRAWCVSQFDGKTMYFHGGSRMDELLKPTYPRR